MMEGDDILFLFFFLMCAHVRAWAHLPYAHICMLSCVQDGCACVHGGLKMMLGDLLYFFHLIYNGRISPSNRELTSAASQPSQLTPVLPALLSLVLITDGPPCTPSICADFVTELWAT